ncbi:flagellar protein FlbD [Synergistales bacterium]|nr:flagellar protein FlbD [Synergistales bacterium]
MIELTRLNGTKFVVNSDHIETVEERPDTVITMLNGHKYNVKESTEEIISAIQTFRRHCSKPIITE